MIDHLVFLAANEDASPEDIEDLISSIRNLKDTVPGVVDLSVGENFSPRSGGYTHGLFVRFETKEDLQGYMEHPEHQAVVEKLDRLTSRIVVDYEVSRA
jgi:antibiotic biosynthesis monooxygenase (ABM) superfamily enzyme